MKRILLVVGLGLCLAVGALKSEEISAFDDLWSRLAKLEHLQGRFEQTQYDQSGTAVTQSSGTFKLLRPDFFAWEIYAPDSQLIIANPEFLWHHDRDLETVTRRPITDNIEFSPLQVLGGRADVLQQRFTISRPGEGQFLLVPKQEGAGFQQLVLIFSGEELQAMEITDNLDQNVNIALLNLDSTASLTESDFAFSPPPGADLFYYEQ